MSYPFLPVNPCCTDVVLNTPCGCSSTITNSGCNSNDPCSTNLTASSTVVYNGSALTCIVAEPCDTLNIILQKIDQIICNLVTQVNYLTNQVTNITTQVISINNDITSIYNTLDVCCSATTTSTTTIAPVICESFSLDNTGTETVAIIITDCTTGELTAVVLEPGVTDICVETDSPLVVPGTVIATPNGPCGTTTTTTTAAPTTTTTTTEAIPCECLTFYNDGDSVHTISYTDCDGSISRPIAIEPNETIQVCGCCGFASDDLVTISIGANCINGECPVPTTTTTTTALCNCFDTEITILSETLASTDDKQVSALYDDCFGNPYINTYDAAGIYSLGCVDQSVGITVLGLVNDVETAFNVPITTDSPCCNITTTTTSTSTIAPTTTTTTTSGCNCVNIIISQDDIDDATGNTVTFFNGKVNLFPEKDTRCLSTDPDPDAYYSTAGTYKYCLKRNLISTLQLTYVKDNEIVTAVQSQIVNLGSNCVNNNNCITTTTTSSSTSTTTSTSSTTTTTTTLAPA